MLMNSRGGPHFGWLYVDEFGPPILRGGPPLGTISMDLVVHNIACFIKVNSSIDFSL
jgi:hypothetical protein